MSHCPPLPNRHRASLGSQQAKMPEHLHPALPNARWAPGDAASPHSAIKEEQETASLTLSLPPPSCPAPRFCCCCREGGAQLLIPLRRLGFLSLDRWGALGVPPSSSGVRLAQHPRQWDPSAPQDCSLLFCLSSSSHL